LNEKSCDDTGNISRIIRPKLSFAGHHLNGISGRDTWKDEPNWQGGSVSVPMVSTSLFQLLIAILITFTITLLFTSRNYRRERRSSGTFEFGMITFGRLVRPNDVDRANRKAPDVDESQKGSKYVEVGWEKVHWMSKKRSRESNKNEHHAKSIQLEEDRRRSTKLAKAWDRGRGRHWGNHADRKVKGGRRTSRKDRGR
jgi:hypothetical protein